MTYAEAVNTLNGRDSKKIANNTTLHRIDEDTIAIRLHNTDIIKFYSDGDVELNSGGWRTVTTKARINKFSDRRVYQRDFSWYIKVAGEEIDFYDGIVV